MTSKQRLSLTKAFRSPEEVERIFFHLFKFGPVRTVFLSYQTHAASTKEASD
jgi:hypothetical protein